MQTWLSGRRPDFRRPGCMRVWRQRHLVRQNRHSRTSAPAVPSNVNCSGPGALDCSPVHMDGGHGHSSWAGVTGHRHGSRRSHREVEWTGAIGTSRRPAWRSQTRPGRRARPLRRAARVQRPHRRSGARLRSCQLITTVPPNSRHSPRWCGSAPSLRDSSMTGVGVEQRRVHDGQGQFQEVRRTSEPEHLRRAGAVADGVVVAPGRVVREPGCFQLPWGLPSK